MVFATIIGLTMAFILEYYVFPGRSVLVTILNTLTGLPPVIVGLFLYILLSRSGPLGFLNILYTPFAMVLAQVILAVPIIAALSHGAVGSSSLAIKATALGLGATPLQAMLAVFKDVRYAICGAVAAALGRVMAEVGAVLLVGGNIAGHTRVMTTAIALETDKGNFELAIALGLVLLTLAFLIHGVLHYSQLRGAKR